MISNDEKKAKPEKEDKKKLKLPQLNDKGSNFRTLAIWLLIILAALYTSKILMPGFQEDVRITYSEFRNQLEKDNIEKIEIIDKEVTGYLKTDEVHVNAEGKVQKYKIFKVNLLPIIDNSIVELMITHKVVLVAKEKGFNFWNIMIVWLPWLLFIGFWLFFMRQMQGGQKGIFNFGKSRARLLSPDKSKVTFDDVAGADEAKQELQEIIEFLKNPSKFTQLGGKIPKGALLLGPPGTGKTLLARAVAGEAVVPFFSMSGSDFVEMFVGVGASRVRDLFETGKRSAPCIIFIDEIDAVGRQRGAGLGGGHDEREQTLNQLLVEMDGFESNEGVILIAATNRPDVLDSALLRPGRFDRQIVVDLPDVKGREGILKVHTQKIKLAANVELEIIAKGTPGMSGADLANLVNEAALLAARKNKTEVSLSELEEAKDKVMMGAERRSMTISQKEKKIIAYHESGHVLIAKFISDSDPIHKVTIIPRGRALGVTHSIPVDDRHLYSKTWVYSKICQLLGGRIAEKLVFNEISSGAGNDIEIATKLSRMMVCEWGMSDSLGTVAYGHKQDEIFLGREISRHRDFSDSTAMKIDEEVKRIIDECFEKSEKILKENFDLLNALSIELLKKEILTSDEIDTILNQIKKKKVSTSAAGVRKHAISSRAHIKILEKTELPEPKPVKETAKEKAKAATKKTDTKPNKVNPSKSVKNKTPEKSSNNSAAWKYLKKKK